MLTSAVPMPLVLSPFLMSSTLFGSDIAGALPCGTDWMAGPSGQMSRVFFAWSEMHCDPEEADEPEEVDDGEADEEPPRPSGPVEFLAAPASRDPPDPIAM